MSCPLSGEVLPVPWSDQQSALAILLINHSATAGVVHLILEFCVTKWRKKVSQPKAANRHFTAVWWKVVGNSRFSWPPDHADKQNWKINANRGLFIVIFIHNLVLILCHKPNVFVTLLFLCIDFRLKPLNSALFSWIILLEMQDLTYGCVGL